MKSAPKFLLVDFENVSKIGAHAPVENLKIKIFLGAQSKVKADFLNKILEMSDHVELIRITGNGPNALDFHIAYYLGILTTQHEGAELRILSKDKGFDPLVEHLKGRGFVIARVESLGEEKPKNPARKAIAAPAPRVSEREKKAAPVSRQPVAAGKNAFAACEEALSNIDVARRPKTRARLLGFLSSRVKAVVALDPQAVITHLEKQGLIRDENGKISYLK